MNNYIKVHIKCNLQEHGHEDTESLWAIEKNGYIYIRNIPFYIYGLAYDDQVEIKLFNDIKYVVGIIHHSGHSTIRIYFFDKDLVKEEVIKIKKLGCDVEISDNPKLVALDIPKNVSFKTIKDYLNEGLENNLWDFEESCLSSFHWEKYKNKI
tara:strand:+ start:153 stop:611 length:459 start_codon:yes stop_codon:yes gene_type:complete